jgi:hypothetical protein
MTARCSCRPPVRRVFLPRHRLEFVIRFGTLETVPGVVIQHIGRQ